MKTSHRTLLAGKNLAVVLAGLALTVVIALMVGKNYLSQIELRESVLQNFRQDLEKQAAVLSYFYSERINDLNNLPAKREISTFFENKALGMSMEYGLRASLITIQESLDLVLKERTLGNRIYTRFVFLDSSGKCLIDTQKSTGSSAAKRTWRRFLTPDRSSPAFVVEPRGELAQLIVTTPYFFKGVYSGQIVAWISTDTVLDHFIPDHDKFSREVLGVFANQEGRYFPLTKTGHAIAAIFPRIAIMRANEWRRFNMAEPGGSPVEMLSIKVPIKDTPLFLLEAIPINKLFVHISPWNLLAALGSLSILSLLGLGFVWRANNRNLILQTRLEEAVIREEEIASKNLQLEGEITERKQAEAALRQSEETLRVLLDANPESVLLLDDKLNVVTTNKTAASRFNKSLEEIMGVRVYDLFSREVADRRRPYLDLALHTGKPVQFEDIRAGIYFHTYAHPILDASGKVSGVAILAIDITERMQAEAALRESEEKYRGLIETNNTGYVILDTEGRVLDANLEYVRLTGYKELKEILGRSVLEWTAGPDRKRQAAAIKRCHEFGHVRHLELDFAGQDGGSIPVEINATAISTSEGVKFLSLVTDVSDRKRAEDEKATLEAQLVQAQKMEAIGTLAGGIAHDFNNILTAIIGNLSLAMLDSQMSEKSRARLSGAERACFQAQNLSRQLLTFSRGGAPIKELVSIKALVSESASFACRGSQVDYEYSLPDNLWGAEADPGQITQVFQNLVINAIQAMPTGGRIKIHGENLGVEAESELPLDMGRYVKISVQDEGIGIAPEHLAKIFDPYFTTKQKGSGLGLATSYSIIKNHHGHIAVDSALGKGTTFTVYLPAINQRFLQHPQEDREMLYGKGHILAMDDEAMVQEVLGRMLLSLGYEVKFAKDGAEAIEIFSQSQKSGDPFEAVILDLTVAGGMGGKDTITRLLKIDPQVKAIVSSGYSDDPIMADFRKYGFTAVIPKPYKITELSRVLHKVLTEKE